MNKPRYEKVDGNTIRVIVEQVSEVPLNELKENREKLLKHKGLLQEQVRQAQGQLSVEEKNIEQAVKNIEEILAEAKKLGIVAKEKKTTIKGTP